MTPIIDGVFTVELNVLEEKMNAATEQLSSTWLPQLLL